VLDQLVLATGDLLGDIQDLTDASARAPSRLPVWSRGHVLTDLSRNAEGGARLLGWARTGVPSYEYESIEVRATAVEAGSGRSASALIDDVRITAAEFSKAASSLPSAACWPASRPRR
jgi:maleylpyruvate isomerase